VYDVKKRKQREPLLPRETRSKVDKVIEQQMELRARPADRRLQRVWPPWNACPPELDSQRRRDVLTGAAQQVDSGLLTALRLEFSYLPFNADEYSPEFDAIKIWQDLKDYDTTTRRDFLNVVKAQWAFSQIDAQAIGRIAIYRATEELAVRFPGLLLKARPSPKNIRMFRERFRDYIHARKRALRALNKILYGMPGIVQQSTPPVGQRAVGIPRPIKRVPHYLFIARLDALNLCSQERFDKFVREEFPKLDRQQRRDFYRISLTTGHGKTSHAALKIWIIDNVPVFEQFDWRWPDIHTEAVNRGLLDKERSPSFQSLMKWASRERMIWRMKTGVPGLRQKDSVDSSRSLLSPRPIFSDSLTTLTSNPS
jgi:hypothetical protein